MVRFEQLERVGQDLIDVDLVEALDDVEYSNIQGKEDEVERICIWTDVKPGETVWTGIPGMYRTAPAEPGIYSFVEYAIGRCHERFAFEAKQDGDVNFA